MKTCMEIVIENVSGSIDMDAAVSRDPENL